MTTTEKERKLVELDRFQEEHAKGWYDCTKCGGKKSVVRYDPTNSIFGRIPTPPYEDVGRCVKCDETYVWMMDGEE
jgi:hypothetical protein